MLRLLAARQVVKLAFFLALANARSPAPRRRASTLTAVRSPQGSKTPLPSTANCTWRNFNQTLDHFAPGAAPYHFNQRLCLYDGFVKPGAAPSVILFYTGNESPVDEYVNNTGLMWETAPELGALLVFAEHRYEGESVPGTDGVPSCMSYATVEQALGDYAAIRVGINHWSTAGLGYLQTPLPRPNRTRFP